MSKRLQDNLTSSYLEAANRLNSRTSRRRIVAYVESYDDVFFWRSILAQFEDEGRYFEVMLPSKQQRLERGKKAALMSALRGKVGQCLIACVDADYDYLLQGRSEASRTILGSPYVFHTYAYAIENMQCYAPSLHEVCVAVTLNDRQVFDMEKYLSDLSEAIFPLFVWNIWYYRSNRYGQFTMTDFLRVIEVGGFSLKGAGDCVRNVKRKVDRRVEMFKRQHPHAREGWVQLMEELRTLGVTPQTTYLYIQGHHLFDKVVAPMLSKVCDKLVRMRQNEISRESIHDTQRRNELSCYTASLQQVAPMLKKNLGFMRSEPYRRIKADLQRFVDGLASGAALPKSASAEGEMP